jgi:predicted DNA-binding mobile mystery protein A
MNTFERLAIQQLDGRLEKLKDPAFSRVSSWIKLLRTTLKLSTHDLAKKLSIRQSAMLAMEKREEDGHITLASMKKLADAMGCDFVYAFIPRTTLENFIEEQEKKLALKLSNLTHHTMKLEDQHMQDSELIKHYEMMRKSISEKSLKYLWKCHVL